MQMKSFVIGMAALIVITAVVKSDAMGKIVHKLTVMAGNEIAVGLKQN